MRERRLRLPASEAVGELGSSGMVNIRESLINVVMINKPKMLTGLNQNGMWLGTECISRSVADIMPPAKR
jgi:hypothetical protein